MIKTLKRYYSFAPYTPTAFIFMYIISMSLVSDRIYFSLDGLLLSLSLSFMGNAMTMINFYLDREADKFAHPERALPSKQISLAEARGLISFMVILAMIPSIFASNKTYYMIIMGVILLYTIICNIKRDKGKSSSVFAVIYYIQASLAFAGCIYMISYGILGKNDYFMCLSCLAFIFFDAGIYIYGNMVDYEGDREAGQKTIISVLGNRASLIFVLICNIVVILLMGYGIFIKMDYMKRIIVLFMLVFLAYKIIMSNVRCLKNEDLTLFYAAREWQRWALFALGFLLIGSKLEPIFLFAPICAILSIQSYVATVKSLNRYNES